MPCSCPWHLILIVAQWPRISSPRTRPVHRGSSRRVNRPQSLGGHVAENVHRGSLATGLHLLAIQVCPVLLRGPTSRRTDPRRRTRKAGPRGGVGIQLLIPSPLEPVNIVVWFHPAAPRLRPPQRHQRISQHHALPAQIDQRQVEALRQVPSLEVCRQRVIGPRAAGKVRLVSVPRRPGRALVN